MTHGRLSSRPKVLGPTGTPYQQLRSLSGSVVGPSSHVFGGVHLKTRPLSNFGLGYPTGATHTSPDDYQAQLFPGALTDQLSIYVWWARLK